MKEEKDIDPLVVLIAITLWILCFGLMFISIYFFVTWLIPEPSVVIQSTQIISSRHCFQNGIPINCSMMGGF